MLQSEIRHPALETPVTLHPLANRLSFGPALLAGLRVNVSHEFGLERLARVRVELQVVVRGVITGEGRLGRALKKLKLPLLLTGKRDG